MHRSSFSISTVNPSNQDRRRVLEKSLRDRFAGKIKEAPCYMLHEVRKS